MVVTMTEIEEHLRENCEFWLKELEKMAEKDIDIGEWLNDNVLELRREQTLIKGEWKTISYILVVTVGGPYVEINDDKVVGCWWSNKIEIRLTPKAKKGYEKVFEFLEEIWGSE